MGTTTLGESLSEELGVIHIDSDDFFWMKTDPPFREVCPTTDCIAGIRNKIAGSQDWVYSGSIGTWGNEFMEEFTLAVFLYLEPSVRMERIEKRENQRYGNRIKPWGDMHEHYKKYMAWAASYDQPDISHNRNKAGHLEWLKKLPFPSISLDSDQPTSEQVRCILKVL